MKTATAENQLKRTIVTTLYRILAIAGIVAYLPSLYLSITEDVWVIAVVDTAGYACILALAFVKRIPLAVQTAALAVLSYLLGVSLLVFTGPFGAGIVYLFAFVLITAMFFPTLATTLANALVALTFAGFWLANHLRLLGWEQGPESLLVIAVNFLLVSLILSHAVSLLMRGLVRHIEAQTVLQNKLNEEAKQKEAEKNRAEEALAMKTRLMNELHHRVKNNLQVISSLVNLHLSKEPGHPDRLQRLKERIDAIALVHRLLYRKEQVASVFLRSILTHILDSLATALQTDRIRFTSDIDVGDVRIGVDQATLISLVLNEIVTNSAKHAFPDGRKGAIDVRASCVGERLTLVAGDDGAGFDRAEWDNKNNFGLEILSTLLKQLHAEFSLDTRHGTRYEITIPIKDENTPGSATAEADGPGAL